MEGLKKIAIVAFAFALEKEEPNKCNVRIAENVERIFLELCEEGYRVYIVAQWEVALKLQADGFYVDFVVYPGESYLGSKEVWQDGKEKVLEPEDISEVVQVSQWLQGFKVRGMIVKDGYTLIRKKIGKIGFDKDSIQWWTRGPVALFIYSVLQAVFHYEGKAPENITPQKPS